MLKRLFEGDFLEAGVVPLNMDMGWQASPMTVTREPLSFAHNDMGLRSYKPKGKREREGGSG